jgi:hypothetical protein
VVVFEEWCAPPIKRLCQALKTELRKWGYPFTVLKPNNLPHQLPPEVQQAYDLAMRELTGEDDDGARDPDE